MSFPPPPPPPQSYSAPPPFPPPTAAAPGREGYAVAALVLGIIPICSGPLGIVFGIVALVRIRTRGTLGRGMAIAGIILGTLWLTLIVVAVTWAILSEPERDDTGAIVAGGTVLSTELRVGDCVKTPPDGVVRTLDVVPCAKEHKAEVYAKFPAGFGSFPGNADIERFAEGGCISRLGAYVGEANVDTYELVYLQPTSGSWAQGDREVACLLTLPGTAPMTGSAKAP